MDERGASEEDVRLTVVDGERFPAKHGRLGFRRNFRFDHHWRGRHYANRQVEVYAVESKSSVLVITVIVKYF